jgi:superfamily II DNA or RNA helicase
LEGADPWLRPFRVTGGSVALGPEWAVWWRLTALVRGLVARGAVAPTYTAGVVRWRLVPGPRELAGLDAATRALPPAALKAPATDGGIADWLDRYADVLVRRAAASRGDLRRLRGGGPAFWWLVALLRPQMADPPPRLLDQEEVHAWLADPALVNGSPQIVLRLDEPPSERPDGWPLGIYAEFPHDPGVLVSVAELPAAPLGRGALLDVMYRRAFLAVREGLHRAAACMPALGAALADGGKTGVGEVVLDTASAWDLLTSARARLEAAGVRVVVPAWWTAPPPRAHLRLALPPSHAGGFTADTLVRFEWEVALGDVRIPPEEFERLVERRMPLVQVAGHWVALPPDAARALAARWADHGPRGELVAGPALLLAIQAAAGAEPATSTAASRPPAVDVAADERVVAQMRALAAEPADAPEPPGFDCVLLPYQRRGLAWLEARARLGLGGVLADDMGLGKTVQVLALVARRLAAGARGPTLVVAPTSVVDNWAAEARRFVPGATTIVHQGARRERGDALRAMACDARLVVTSYALLRRDADALAAVAWDGVVLDEAQNVKNASARQAQAARGLRAGYRLALTGTPIENALSDLWSIFAFVQPGYLGSREGFGRRLAGPIERERDEAAAGLLRRLVGPLILRRTKDDPGVADDLPPRIETLQHCALTPEQAALYEAVVRDALRRIETATGMARRAAILVAMLRLKQVCDHPALFTGDRSPLRARSGKLARLEELLAEVAAEDDKALVFTQFSSWGRRLAEHLAAVLPGVPILRLDGATPAVERTAVVERFQRQPGPGVFVLSLKAGGAGLNLTAARVVFHYDRWWNPAVERQATDRAHRIGQERSVLVHKLVCPGTLEERIDQLIRSKESLADSVLGGSGDTWVTELDDGALAEVLRLRRAALL